MKKREATNTAGMMGTDIRVFLISTGLSFYIYLVSSSPLRSRKSRDVDFVDEPVCKGHRTVFTRKDYEGHGTEGSEEKVCLQAFFRRRVPRSRT